MVRLAISGYSFILICDRCSGHLQHTNVMIHCPQCNAGITIPNKEEIRAALLGTEDYRELTRPNPPKKSKYTDKKPENMPPT
jgi:hypothetical protein